MISLISKALSSGFTTNQVLQFILKKFPQHADKIKSAMTAGFTVDQIIGQLSGDKKLKQKPTEPQYQTEHEQTRSRDIQQRENINNTALSTAALAGGSLAAPMAAKALQRALPSSLSTMTPSLTTALQQQTQSPPPSQSPLNLSNQPQQQPINPITQPNIPIEQPKEIVKEDILPEKQIKSLLIPKEEAAKKLSSMGKDVLSKVDNMLKNGNPPEAISAVLTSQGKSRGKTDEDLINTIESYAQEKQDLESPEIEEIEEVEERPISKKDTIAVPQGIGKVLETRGNKALIEIDGKKHQVNLDETIQSPLPEKDLADLYNNLIGGIEKHTGQEVSRNVEWAGYDPKNNELAYRPHGGQLYVYDNISPEDAELLTSLLTKRKSTGENHIGVWEKDTDSPIGAAMYQLIQKLQKERGGKGNEYKNRFDIIYDAFEPARTASKEKKRESDKKLAAERKVLKPKKTKKPKAH